MPEEQRFSVQVVEESSFSWKWDLDKEMEIGHAGWEEKEMACFGGDDFGNRIHGDLRQLFNQYGETQEGVV
ncbi:MAG: hypothetical protein ACLUDG_01220 [Butyricicoccus sp.]